MRGTGQPWARIPMAATANGQQSIAQVLEGWFYGAETPAQLEVGDVPMDEQFGEHMVAVPMDPLTWTARVDVTQIRPSHQRYFVFYSHGRALSSGPAGGPVHFLDLWGGLPVEALLSLCQQNGGVVRRDEDLLWRPAQETRCRALYQRLPAPDTPGPQMEAWKAHYFVFPLVGAEFQDALHNAYPITGYVFDVFFKRLESYTVAITDSAPFPAGATLEQRLWDKASFLLCANLTRELYPQEVALAYEKVRTERERILYWNRWAPFLAPGVGELPVLGLLQYNPGLWHWLMERMTEPTPEDEQAWFRTRPPGPAAAMPAVWFALPCHQIPLSLKDVRAQFPVHAGGVIHVPAEARWMAPWIWDALVVPEAQRRFALPPIPKQSSMLQRLGMLEEAKSWAQRARAPMARPTNGGGGGGTSGASGQHAAAPPPLDEGGGVDIEELDRLWTVLPPCIRRIREERRFLRNYERMVAVEVMRLGGLSLQSMIFFFEKLNKHYPKPRPETLQQRFDVEACVEWWKPKEGEDMIWCSSLVNNALDKGAGAGVLVCPYALAHVGPVADGDRPQFTGQCREQCVATSGCAGPRRQPHWKPWASPGAALKEALISNTK